MKATILLFHRTNTVRDRLWDPMSPQLFEKIMCFVSKNYQVLPLEEICLNNPVTKKKPFAITFDDGYKDYIDYALPILKKYNLPSTMFVVTDCVENNLPPWTYIMDYLFLNTQKLQLPFYDYGSECAAFSAYSWKNKDEQILYAKNFKPFLKKIDNKKRGEIINHFINEFDDVSLQSNLMMSWDDLRSLKNENVQIGSHTISHPALTTINDEGLLNTELKMSGEIIEKKLGYFPTTISYPLGSYNQKVKDAAQKAGYTIGLAVNQVSYHSNKHDMFEIPRLELYNGSFLRNKIKIYGIEAAIKHITRQ